MRRPLLIILTLVGSLVLAAVGAVLKFIVLQAADNVIITFDPKGSCLHMKGDPAAAVENCTAMIENPATPPLERAWAYRSRGMFYAQARQNQRAIADYTAALAIAPRDASALIARGQAYAATGSFQKALADYNSALTYQPDSIQGLFSRAHLYLNYEQPALALADYDRVIALEPRLAGAYADRAAANRNLKYYDRALADADKSIELAPRYAYGHYERGLAHIELERYAQAEADFSRALDIDPRDRFAYMARAIAFEQLDQRDFALRDLDMAVALDPRNTAFLRHRARLYAHFARWHDAIGDLTYILAQHAGDTQALMMRAQAYENVGDRENAILDHRTVLRFNPLYRDSLEALKRLGAQTGTGSGDGCRDLKLPAPDRLADCGRVAADPNATADQKAAALLARGKILMLMNDLPKALADFDQAIKLKPGIADAHTERGLVFMRRGDHAEALKSFDRALAVDPRSMTGARIFRSNSLIALGRYDAALAELDRAAAESPNDPGVFHLRGLAFEKMGQRDRAIADYREALRRFPQFGDAQEGLKRLGARWAMPSPTRTIGNEPRTWIQWFLWHIAVTKRGDINDIERDLVAEFERLYEDTGYFSDAKMTGISFMFGFADNVEQHLRVGRVRKNGMLSVDIALNSDIWEHATTGQLKHEMRLAMLRAVVKAGVRYKLPIRTFESRLRDAQT